ncbi:MAG: PD40 domain-containing protein, partial [Acidobacteria bacterium]|nr:PD40 domain-containing protein [Acidobacteriota bacterium]
VIHPLTDLKTDGHSSKTIDDAGTAVFAGYKADPFGSNPLHATQIVGWTVPGGSASQVGAFSRGIYQTVSVSDDGAWLAVASTSDPVGQNHDLSPELFLVSSDGATIVQLTNDPALNAGSVVFAMISGSGNRILFLADTDPLLSNPGRHRQLFIIDTDGTNLTQLTNTTGGGDFRGATLSDDGSRVAFSYSGDLTGGNPDGTWEVFGIASDGTQLLQQTSSPIFSSEFPIISGNGSWIVFRYAFDEVWMVRWRQITPALLIEGRGASITDDAQFVYYSADDSDNQEIFRIPASGGVATQLTFTSLPLSNFSPVVSGANARIVFSASGGAHPGGSNPDGGSELMVMDADGNNIQQLTNNITTGAGDVDPDVTPDGSRIVFGFGFGNSGYLFRVQSDGSDLTQLTTNQQVFHSTVSSDGTKIAFASREDVTGQAEPCNLPQIFRINADGTGLMPLLTPVACISFGDYPEIAGDGSFVLFQDINADLSTVPYDGGAVTQIVSDGSTLRKNPHLSENGQWVAYHSPSDFDGLNPGGQIQVFRARTDGTLIERLTADPGFISWHPDIDANGSRVVYVSSADPLGTNPDHNGEIFLFDASTAATQQLTVTTSGEASDPRISGDGEFVYFISSSPFFETLPTERFDLYRVTVVTGLVERAAGLRDPLTGFNPIGLRDRPPYVADSGGRAIVSGALLATNVNFDGNDQLWFVDFDAPARIRPGKAAPTVVSWDVEPAPLRYDVIRGDVANLQPSGPGEIDLGPVVCIEDDSPDNDTLGSEDVTQPAPGQVLFYVHRGSRGLLAGPGSYDLASDGSERVPASGDCQP